MSKEALIAWFREFGSICEDACSGISDPRAKTFVRSFIRDCDEITDGIERDAFPHEDVISDYITMREE